VNGPRRSALARAAWAGWRALLLLNTLGLLAVAIYAALASPDDGPGATPLIMAGLLSLCVIILAIVSAVDAALWASAMKLRWWLRLLWIALALAGAAIVLQLAIYARDPVDPVLKWLGLLLFVISVLAAHALNTRAVSYYRKNA
jgi:hypothetical protein